MMSNQPEVEEVMTTILLLPFAIIIIIARRDLRKWEGEMPVTLLQGVVVVVDVHCRRITIIEAEEMMMARITVVVIIILPNTSVRMRRLLGFIVVVVMIIVVVISSSSGSTQIHPPTTIP